MLELKAKPRQVKGSKVAALRRKGLMPAVFYGPEVENVNLVVDEREFSLVFEKVGEASMFNLKIEGDSKEHLVLVKEVEVHPLTGQLVHADFYQPILTEKVETTVPLVFEDKAPAVKEKGGVLVKNISEVEVSALPTDLPSEIKVSVKNLKEFNDVVTVKDLNLPQGVEVMRDQDDVVATISAPKTAEELMEEMERGEEELFVGEEVPLEPSPAEPLGEEPEEELEQEEIEL